MRLVCLYINLFIILLLKTFLLESVACVQCSGAKHNEDQESMHMVTESPAERQL